jgi:hypothetical protein
MAISRIGSASAEATTITIPSGHRVGDLMVIFAFRDGSTTNPTIPAGWTNITNTTDGTLCSVSMGYKRCTSTSETSGTWTNATALVCMVYSGAISSSNPFGSVAASSGSTNTVNYAARALASSGVTGSSWFLAFAGHTSVDTTVETAPSGMTMQTNTAGATAEVAGFDTNGLATGNWPSTNVSISGTASNWQTVVIELKAQPTAFENYKSFKGGNGLWLNERVA